MIIRSSVGGIREDLPLVYVNVKPVKLHVGGTGGDANASASVDSKVITYRGTAYASKTNENVADSVLISLGEISTVAAE